ncbi:hypothetical protein ACE6ED_11850 [Paenibacillus sp. CN-4]|uniref:hypothetical protein n=1 Tax=Paenibacillus nanchangensis TaxID=3348343 RepID=UPI00397930EC
MKKVIIIFTALLLLSSFPITRIDAAADKKSATVSIPANTGLNGPDNSAKTFLLELPSSVPKEAIIASSLKYTGNNEKLGLSIENGKIQVTLKGTQNNKIVEVQGYEGSHARMYRTDIYNSIWLYSDGRRWQINEYDENRNTMKTRDVNAADGYPSKNPPKTIVTAGPLQSKDSLKWYNGSKTDVVESQNVIANSIKSEITGYSAYASEEPKFKNGRVIINYEIPNTIPYEPEPSDGLSGKAEGRKYFAFVEYYYTAQAKITTYSYGGTVTFDYQLPNEPTLTGSAAVLAPNPNPFKFEGNDVKVKLSIKGELLGYTDTSNISEWVFYAKEKGNDASLAQKKIFDKALATSNTFDHFVISKSKLASAEKAIQDYNLTVRIRFKKPVTSGGKSVDYLDKAFTATVEVYKTNPTVVVPPPGGTPQKPTQKPPVAVIDGPDLVKAGEDFFISGERSYDPDGTIVDYKWNLPGVQEEVSGKNGWTWYPISKMGMNSGTLRVTDNDDMSRGTSTRIEVIAPTPVASIIARGTLKENRKVTLKNKSRSPEHYPLVAEKTRITITAVSGGSNADIKYSGSLNGMQEKDVIFKKPGTYKATITVENTAGYSDTNSVTFDIVPDQAPVAYIGVPSEAYRDPENGNQAVVSLIDMSFSPDFDFLARRVWEYRYDSNNNGSFEDEGWTVANSENLTTIRLTLIEVGRYEVKLTVFEEFDQPTIPEFITEADRKFGDTRTQSQIEKIVTVKNRAPEVDWSL